MPVIALAGMIGSGKSSLTKSIAEHLNTGYALVGRPIELTEDCIRPEFWLHILTLDGLEEVEDDE
ncbi:hypothetical protein [Companilactobacillus mishanensis]|uniref:Deoxynucleoside kinase domain-containing protein n=1 Tax=Companilactobacillus mishanensis TaxID=2486008 RepID=A0ABW9P3Y2_9LACO|nr:hypothetical protein [Companilactobacillus mishanensis]MQS43969.1 hypothetical protein [Companilactobacillus mishanensis]